MFDEHLQRYWSVGNRCRGSAGLDYIPRFRLTDSQLRNIRQGQNMQTGTAIDAQEAGANFALLEENYWHRILLNEDAIRSAGSN